MQAMQPVPRERIHELVVEQKAQIAEMIQDVLHKRFQERVVEQMVEVVQTISQERRERRRLDRRCHGASDVGREDQCGRLHAAGFAAGRGRKG